MMWRFFRLGVKHNSCTGNQTHFRIIGSTCANADCDDVEDINKYDDKNFKPICDKENFASAASKHFHKKLQSQENSVLKLNEKRKDAYKKFGVKKAILQESSQNHCGNTHKNEGRVKNYSNSDNAKLEANINLSINDDENIEFGSLAENTRKTDFLPDDPDEKGILEPRHIAQTYGRIILEFCKERKIKEALNVLEVEMKNKDVAPNSYCFNILINACGKMGYTKKAFDLYYQMKKRGVYVEKFAYTGLFNACANSPFKPEGLKLATTLRKQIIQNEILLHPISYHAMIKAFGYCGDIKTAFEIVDEMILKDHEVTTETLSFLLHACISDKETGFRHALMVWRKFRILLIEPNIYSYNLLLRCTKECKAGDTQLLSELLDELKDSSKVKGKLKKIRDKKWANLKRFSPATYKAITQSGKPALEGKKGDSFSKPKEIESKEIIEPFCQIGDNNKIVKVDLQPNMELELVSPEKITSQKNEEFVLPNVLSYNIEPGNILAISSLDKKEDRMWLLGGVSGILRSMKEDGVKPTVVTCVHILESLPSTLEVEEALLASMENLKIKPDVIFCNKLIQKRCMRKSLQEAKEVLTLMQEYNVPMDLITFGCLAIGCQRPSEIRQLLRDMKNSSVVPSEEIMETLILNSVKRAEYGLAIELLGRMKRLEVPVTEDLLSILERTRSKIKTNLVEIESESADTEVTPRQRRIRDEMKLYLMEYKHFLKTSRVEFKEHPWAQFGYTERPNKVVKKDAV